MMTRLVRRQMRQTTARSFRGSSDIDRSIKGGSIMEEVSEECEPVPQLTPARPKRAAPGHDASTADRFAADLPSIREAPALAEIPSERSHAFKEWIDPRSR